MRHIYQWEKAEAEKFSKIYKLMTEAFPPSEIRNEEGQRNLLGRSAYQLYTVKQDNEIYGLLGVWEFDTFIFIEHFAVDASLRGNGIGGMLLNDFLNHMEKTVFLEVEEPGTDLARRRIGFYERAGFCLNDFDYIQPDLQQGQSSLPLKNMTYPMKLSKEDFERMKQQIFETVYQIKA